MATLKRSSVTAWDSWPKLIKCVHVTLKSGLVREFDLVVGADGLHSRIRELAFGPEYCFEKYLGFKVAALIADGYQPRDELAYVMFTEIGHWRVVFAW